MLGLSNVTHVCSACSPGALTPPHLPEGRLKNLLLAACRKRLVSGFESLLCPFFHRFNFCAVPDRSFPVFTIVFLEFEFSFSLPHLSLAHTQQSHLIDVTGLRCVGVCALPPTVARGRASTSLLRVRPHCREHVSIRVCWGRD